MHFIRWLAVSLAVFTAVFEHGRIVKLRFNIRINKAAQFVMGSLQVGHPFVMCKRAFALPQKVFVI